MHRLLSNVVDAVRYSQESASDSLSYHPLHLSGGASLRGRENN